ncbi:patatin-like phospholipase family protein [Parachitinimonas caeni]|uniref:Patatin-like phospholipase family protein n=1 Tax=Parachitinimonas caeni TaxID=3031301 RepID=A0ABT7DSK0_9NEIS|nr:patatin-like phospholipase family protein [Parachitinimonas caeni]MDK2122939.1 patatin-like phospholipase family protein [Parachitinimonas caeni]
MPALPPDAPSRRKALLIGGGAPNATLMAGALVAFIRQGVEFDVISTSGAGALIGLLYATPNGGDPIKALESTLHMGVSDSIYRAFPINYKVFQKPGMFADLFRQMLYGNPLARQIVDQFGDNAMQRLASDWIQLLWASMSPSDLNADSKGLCAHVPFAEEIVDFRRLPGIGPEFYINAYNITRGHMQVWNKHEITPDHFRAALSFPFIYPPYQIGDDLFIEGAAIDTINFKALVRDEPGQEGMHRDLDTLVVFDILGTYKLISEPRNLYDAWVRSIITPLVEIAKDDVRMFELKHNLDPATGEAKRRLLKVDLMGGIPEAHWPKVLDWSASNLELLYKVGFNAGLAFCKEHEKALAIRYNAKVEPMPLA